MIAKSSYLIYRLYALFSQFFRYWTRSHGIILFRSKSWFQANDFVLCTCNWLVSSCKMLVLRPYWRVLFLPHSARLILLLKVCIPVVDYLFVWRLLQPRRFFLSSYPSFRHSPLSMPSLTRFLVYSHLIEDYLKIRLRIFGVHPMWSSSGRHGHLVDSL